MNQFIKLEWLNTRNNQLQLIKILSFLLSWPIVIYYLQHSHTLLTKIFLLQLTIYGYYGVILGIIVVLCQRKIELKSIQIVMILTGLVCLFTSLSWCDFYQPTVNSTTNDKFFIAGNLYNNEGIFENYKYQIDRFIEMVGHKNVFISIVENNSWDKTPKLLREWSQKLLVKGVQNEIVTGLKMPSRRSIDRIERLSYLRNVALQPFFDVKNGFVELNSTLPKLHHKLGETSRVIFINDVVFFKEDLAKLINTNQGSYDAACAADYMNDIMYDLWVTRDSKGKQLIPFYPYFQDSKDQQRWINNEPVEVYSCWNGIVALKPQLLINHFTPQLITAKPFPNSLPKFTLIPSQPNLPGVRFRSQNEPGVCYTSECFLIWFDLRQLQPNLKLLMNPTVNVYYDYENYIKFTEQLRWTSTKQQRIKEFPKYKLHQVIEHRDQDKYDCWPVDYDMRYGH